MEEQQSKLAFSVKEAAHALGVHENTIWAMLRRRELPSVRAGRRVLIPRAALESFLKVGH